MSNMDNESVEPITRKEHNPDAAAKRTVLRYQNPSDGEWYNFVPNQVGGVDYDFIDGQQTSPTVDTYVFKNGGSGGATIKTITVTYTDTDKVNINTVAWS